MIDRSAAFLETREYECLFDRSWDTVVVGGGYSGFSAANALHAMGRAVLLIAEQGDLLWESGRAFAPQTGRSDSSSWKNWIASLDSAGGYDGTYTDGAIAEVLANHRVLESGINLLSYAIPVGLESEGDRITSLFLATKGGVRRLVGSRFIDATESGLLFRLLDQDFECPHPLETVVSLFFQQSCWPDPLPMVDDRALQWHRSPWDSERRLIVTERGSGGPVPARILAAVEKVWRENPRLLARAQLSHASAIPFPVYDSFPHSAPAPRSNLVSAVPALHSRPITQLAERHELGLAAADQAPRIPIEGDSKDRFEKPIPPIEPREAVHCDVLVAGLGTGGVMAALAAGRLLSPLDRSVVGLEATNVLGGTGTAGGIHGYYFGVPGGLQEVVDRRTRERMEEYGDVFASPTFNPEAKKIALQEFLDAASVNQMMGALLYHVEVKEECIRHLDVATPTGPVRIRAKGWIDGTGDGDLCEKTGVPFTFGRAIDGQPEPYSQSGGHLFLKDGQPRIRKVNFDAGWCDPTDPEDLTRARLLGVDHYYHEVYDPSNRPTYIAPLIGIRQSRQFETDLRLELEDLVAGRTFSDTIGYSGCHVDTHDIDHAFEDDDVVFWRWALAKGNEHIGLHIPYRVMLPRGLTNVWIASRCLGLSQGTHFSFRMQRDIQRVGEAAGYAAAEAVIQQKDGRTLDFQSIRRHLEAAGSLELGDWSEDKRNGPVFDTTFFQRASELDVTHKALAALDSGRPDLSLFLYWRANTEPTPQVVRALESANPTTRFLAASLLAMYQDSRAEAELVRILEAAWENPDHDPIREGRASTRGLPPTPWLVALALLRRCGTGSCIPTLLVWSQSPQRLSLHARATLLLTLEQLADRGAIASSFESQVEEAIDRLLQSPVADEVYANNPIYFPYMEAVFRGEDAEMKTIVRAIPRAAENHRWQLDLAACRARLALKLPIAHLAHAWIRDYRSIVRKAFSRLLERQPIPLRLYYRDQIKVRQGQNAPSDNRDRSSGPDG